jgi:hypothetical protein
MAVANGGPAAIIGREWSADLAAVSRKQHRWSELMSRIGQFRADLRSVVLNLLANVIWLVLTVISVAAFLFVTRSLAGRGLSAPITAPAWLVLIFALIGIGSAVYVFVTSRKASAVRGRDHATKSNVDLLASRSKLEVSNRVIRSTRFSGWPPGEDSGNRERFREELDKAILKEGSDVRRIWNISSSHDVNRLRELLERYQGRTNHSIRAYFGVENHLLPEILVVDECGASISFASTTRPNLDWAISMKRSDLVDVIRIYFDGLWDRAEKIFDSGKITQSGQVALKRFETGLQE